MGCCYKAIGDQTRRKILALLSNGEMAAGDIAKRFNTSQPTVSNHLKVLKEANLIQERRHKQNRYYTLNRRELRGIIGELSKILG